MYDPPSPLFIVLRDRQHYSISLSLAAQLHLRRCNKAYGSITSTHVTQSLSYLLWFESDMHHRHFRHLVGHTIPLRYTYGVQYSVYRPIIILLKDLLRVLKWHP